jgi:biopolymer transport protein TolR
MSMAVSSKKGSMANINITPYIDILLVLLIIFMVITPIKQMDLDIKIPQNRENEVAVPDPNMIVVSIGEYSQIQVNSQPTTIKELDSKLRDIYKQRSNKNMFISASPKLIYGDVVRIIDIAKGAGVLGDIGLMTEKNE